MQVVNGTSKNKIIEQESARINRIGTPLISDIKIIRHRLKTTECTNYT